MRMKFNKFLAFIDGSSHAIPFFRFFCVEIFDLILTLCQFEASFFCYSLFFKKIIHEIEHKSFFDLFVTLDVLICSTFFSYFIMIFNIKIETP